MADYAASTYGDRIAEVYDTYPHLPKDTDDAVEFLASIAGRGRVLELGIGTGRVALPLAARGLRVSGIDASQAMVKRLRAKPGGKELAVAIGDFAEVKVPGQYSLIYVVFNTFFALLTQDAQVRCFERAARRLSRDGVFVIEAFVPDLTRFDRGQRTSAFSVTTDSVLLETSVIDLAEQYNRSAHVEISEQGIRFYPVQLRWAFPAELDLMARLAGLRLRERFGGWKRESFGPQSGRHVSVYERAATVAAPKRKR
jgi:SAM-dependent methyltransferase